MVNVVAPPVAAWHLSLYAPPAPAKPQQFPFVQTGLPPPPTITVLAQIALDGNVYV
jgi:hypothetical protein